MGVRDRPGAGACDKADPGQLGADGWELVQIVPGMNAENLVAYLKRPIEQAAGEQS